MYLFLGDLVAFKNIFIWGYILHSFESITLVWVMTADLK